MSNTAQMETQTPETGLRNIKTPNAIIKQIV